MKNYSMPPIKHLHVRGAILLLAILSATVVWSAEGGEDSTQKTDDGGTPAIVSKKQLIEAEAPGMTSRKKVAEGDATSSDKKKPVESSVTAKKKDGEANISAESKKDSEKTKSATNGPPESTAKQMGDKVREALGVDVPKRNLTLLINGRAVATAPSTGGSSRSPGKSLAASGSGGVVAQTSRMALEARAAAQGASPAGKIQTSPMMEGPHWSYEGESGPANWARLSPQYSLCAVGRRQSPINIPEGDTLQGPAEAVQFHYTPSEAMVVNNGHGIQVDVQDENRITVRGSTYHLMQVQFHSPSEERVNYNQHPMAVHLIHQNDDGQLAIVAVMLDIGEANDLVNKVWTYMPLDVGDRVRMPSHLLNLNEILPVDQRYYQYFGSLTTPPCTENVLWLVMKQALPVSQAQFKLFTQLYPMNARPVQPLNGRPVREAM